MLHIKTFLTYTRLWITYSHKEILLDQGITPNDISILGKGENELAIDTPDNTKHPANRRAEVKILN